MARTKNVATCLVTGAAGILGRETTAALARRGWDIVSLGRSECPAPGAKRHIRFDLETGVPEAAALRGIDAIVHLAAALPGDPPARYQLINVESTRGLAAAAAEAGVLRFVVVSSTRAVAPNGAADRLDDHSIPAPGDPYGRSKREGELAASAAFPGAVILRPPLILGPGLRGSMAHLLRLCALPLPLPLRALSAPRSYATAQDVAAAIAHLLHLDTPPAHPMLVASPGTLSVARIAEIAREALGWKSPGLFPVPVQIVAPAVRLLFGADAAAALIRPLVLVPTFLARTGFSCTSDLEDAVRNLARLAMQGRSA